MYHTGVYHYRVRNSPVCSVIVSPGEKVRVPGHTDHQSVGYGKNYSKGGNEVPLVRKDISFTVGIQDVVVEYTQ